MNIITCSKAVVSNKSEVKEEKVGIEKFSLFSHSKNGGVLNKCIKWSAL